MSESKISWVVGIGASAGGLEALEKLFVNMPDDTGLVFIVVQHLSPDYKSLMVELLSRYTKMKVIRAEDNMQIEPNCVYLIPPKMNMTISNEKLHLKEVDTAHGLNLPIDIFFKSLAEDKGEYSIGIILSGTGSDGTAGIKAIKSSGGLVIVQDEESAKFDGMPKSALSTGLVDYVLPPEKIPEQIINYIKNPYLKKSGIYPLLNDDSKLNKILNIIRNKTGVDFSYYRPNTILRRLERRLGINQIEDVEHYINYLETSPYEVFILFKELLIGVTRFFRDKEVFEYLKENVLKNIIKSKDPKDTIRVWCAGCSTGEEAYSLAILFKETMRELEIEREVKIFATDLDRESIEVGSIGVYSESVVNEVNPDLLNKYFTKKANGYMVNENIRRMVIFACHNVIKDPPFSKIDLISCRNLLIYVKPQIQKKILSLFNYSLSGSGYLVLGTSETVGELSDLFITIEPKMKIYKSIVVSNTFLSKSSEPNLSDITLRNVNNNIYSYKQDYFMEGIYEVLFNKYAPVTIILDINYNVINILGDADKYLKIPTGRMNNNIIKMLRNDLQLIVSNGLHKCLKTNSEVVYDNYVYNYNDQKEILKLIFKPYLDRRNNNIYILLIFEKLNKEEEFKKENIVIDTEKDSYAKIKELEMELQHTRENLQATIEELETSNEELQSTNEELIAANEELQSTNEELQSVNEELYTVNSEYQKKIEELTEVNNDIINLLSNTNIGVIFLDMNLNIRRFTPAVEKIINIQQIDIGRPISHFSHNLEYLNFLDDINSVLKDLIPKSFEINTKDQKWYFIKILPYRTINNAINGVVITFQDITDKKNYEYRLLNEKMKLMTILDNSPIGKFAVDTNGRITYINKKIEEMFNMSKENIMNTIYYFTLLKYKARVIDEKQEELPHNIVINTKKPLVDYKLKIKDENLSKNLIISCSPVFNEKNEVVEVIFSVYEEK